MSTRAATTGQDVRRVYLARQPVFDIDNRVHAYEILFRSSADADSAAGETRTMGRRVMVDSLLGIGIADLTGGRPAFVNVDRGILLDGSVELMDPAQVVIEILEGVTPDKQVIAAVEALVEKGYSIALDDFVFRPGMEELLVLAAIVKIDLLAHDEQSLSDLVQKLRPYGGALLAEKVEDAATHQRCVDLGFELFQGYHFSRPQMLERRDLSIEQLNVMRLLNIINDQETSDHDLETIFRGDVSLSYKLLRMVNSASMGGRGISSIGHAVRLLGRRTLYRWLALMLAAEGSTGGPRGELVHSALLRARMAENLAVHTGRAGLAPALYLCGLFSRLDALLGTPMEELLDRLDLRPEVYQALAGRRGPLAPILSLVEAYEGARWLEVPALMRAANLEEIDLREMYLEALQDADRHLATLEDGPVQGVT
jgi:c-di-GMP phosphodiesterase